MSYVELLWGSVSDRVVVESLYFGEASAMSWFGGDEDGARPLIIQTEGVGSFRRHGMSTGRLW